MSDILVSVIMPVYNGSLYVSSSVESILGQTHKNFELIIINDGSVDSSEAEIMKFNDPRILYLKQDNHGLSATLNKGVLLSKGHYIARQDQDDISHPNRIEMRLNAMISRNLDLIGSRSLVIDECGRVIGRHNHPLSHNAIRLFMLFDNPFVHSSVMFKRELLINNMYSEDKIRQPPEDYELWSRLSGNCKMENLPDRLIKYRQLGTGMSLMNKEKFASRVIQFGGENMVNTNPSLLLTDAINLCKLYHNQEKVNLRYFMPILIKHYQLMRLVSDRTCKLDFLLVYLKQLLKIIKGYLRNV